MVTTSGEATERSAFWARLTTQLGGWARSAGPLTLPARLLVGALASAVTGTGLGVLAEYGAYVYAYQHGIRPPLEGIPYLRVAVTGLTVMTMLSAAVVFAAVYGAAMLILFVLHQQLAQTEQLLRLARKLVPDVPADILSFEAFLRAARSVSFRYAFTFAIGVGILVFAVGGSVAWFTGDRLLTVAPAAGVATITVLLLWNRQVAMWLALASVVGVLIVGPMLVFNVRAYGATLRLLGYGGGVPVTVVVSSSGSAENRERTVSSTNATKPATDLSIQGALLLRTNEALIVFDTDRRVVREIPLSRIQNIDHAVNQVHHQAIQDLINRAGSR